MSTIKVLGKQAGKLKEKNVLIIGVGGLGCTVANLLSRLEVKLKLVDDDIVDDTNLERQILFYKKDLLKNKVNVAKDRLSQFTNIQAISDRLTEKNISKLIPKNVDLVIDCTDNVETRLLLNDYCLKNKINWIYSGAVSNIGSVYFINNKNDGPCFRCFNQEKTGDTSCEIGVLNSTVTMIAAITVNIAVNYLVLGKIEDKLIRINMKDNSMTKINVKKNSKCSCKGVK